MPKTETENGSIAFQMHVRAVILLLCVLALVAFTGLVLHSVHAQTLQPHAPISIEGNGGFTVDNGVRGGSGTASDPYVIEGWEINESGAVTCNSFAISCALNVRNTDSHFVVRNTYIHSAWYGVVFTNVTNGIVEDSVVADNQRGGIVITNSVDLQLVECNVTGNGYWYDRYLPPEPGITVWSSTNVTLSNNTISNPNGGLESYNNSDISASKNLFRSGLSSLGDNITIDHNQFLSGSGISLQYGKHASISTNTFSSAGIFLGSIPVTIPSTILISNDNLVAGKPVYYFNGCAGTGVDGVPVGQLIVANCTDFHASNLQISETTIGLVMSNVSHALVTGIKFSDNRIAFSFSSSNQVTFSHNDLVRSGNWWYSWFDHVSDSSVIGNNVSSTVYGFGITHGQNITLSENNFHETASLYLESSSNIHVYHNNFFQTATDFLGSQNRWDNGYPSGGNYWSSYGGIDKCGGPMQNICPSPDGIGDTPMGYDRYPLIHPFVSQVTGIVGFNPATIVSPNTRYLTAVIQMPSGINASEIVFSSIRLNNTVSPITQHSVVLPSVAHQVLVRFDMAQVIDLLHSSGNYTLQISFNIVDPSSFRSFTASASIRFLNNMD